MSDESRSELDHAIAESLIEFIQRELLSPQESIGLRDDLLSDELLDSLGVLRLSRFVEEQFQIRIQPTDFVVENFQNVEALTRFVQRATGTSAARDTTR